MNLIDIAQESIQITKHFSKDSSAPRSPALVY